MDRYRQAIFRIYQIHLLRQDIFLYLKRGVLCRLKAFCANQSYLGREKEVGKPIFKVGKARSYFLNWHLHEFLWRVQEAYLFGNQNGIRLIIPHDSKPFKARVMNGIKEGGNFPHLYRRKRKRVSSALDTLFILVRRTASQ